MGSGSATCSPSGRSGSEDRAAVRVRPARPGAPGRRGGRRVRTSRTGRAGGGARLRTSAVRFRSSGPRAVLARPIGATRFAASRRPLVEGVIALQPENGSDGTRTRDLRGDRREQAGITGESRASRLWACGDCRAPAEASGDLLRDVVGLPRASSCVFARKAFESVFRGELIESLMRRGLIDEYMLMIHPARPRIGAPPLRRRQSRYETSGWSTLRQRLPALRSRLTSRLRTRRCDVSTAAVRAVCRRRPATGRRVDVGSAGMGHQKREWATADRKRGPDRAPATRSDGRQTAVG
jgi:hypothetical protein